MDNLSNIFRLVNLGVGALMVFGGISQFFYPSVRNIVVGIYVILFGAATALLEFQIPPQLSRHASFLFSFIGRGVFYVFVGVLLLSDGALRWIAGSLVAAIGVGYAVLEFVPSIEPPDNMRDAQWDGEQV